MDDSEPLALEGVDRRHIEYINLTNFNTWKCKGFIHVLVLVEADGVYHTCRNIAKA